MTGAGKAKSSFLQLVWLLCTWVLWIERNNRLFNIVTEVPRLLDKIKVLSLAWLKAKKATFVLFLALICGGQVLWLVWALTKHCWCFLSFKRCP